MVQYAEDQQKTVQYIVEFIKILVNKYDIEFQRVSDSSNFLTMVEC